MCLITMRTQSLSVSVSACTRVFIRICVLPVAIWVWQFAPYWTQLSSVEFSSAQLGSVSVSVSVWICQHCSTKVFQLDMPRPRASPEAEVTDITVRPAASKGCFHFHLLSFCHRLLENGHWTKGWGYLATIPSPIINVKLNQSALAGGSSSVKIRNSRLST